MATCLCLSLQLPHLATLTSTRLGASFSHVFFDPQTWIPTRFWKMRRPRRNSLGRYDPKILRGGGGKWIEFQLKICQISPFFQYLLWLSRESLAKLGLVMRSEACRVKETDVTTSLVNWSNYLIFRKTFSLSFSPVFIQQPNGSVSPSWTQTLTWLCPQNLKGEEKERKEKTVWIRNFFFATTWCVSQHFGDLN